jgi:hypothetical protein
MISSDLHSSDGIRKKVREWSFKLSRCAALIDVLRLQAIMATVDNHSAANKSHFDSIAHQYDDNHSAVKRAEKFAPPKDYYS